MMKIHHLAFSNYCQAFFNKLHEDEALNIYLYAEESQFIRFNQAKVRQTGTVFQAKAYLSLKKAGRFIRMEIDYASNPQAEDTLTELRALASIYPADKYAADFFKSTSKTEPTFEDNFLAPDMITEVLHPLQGLDACGFFSGGIIIEAQQNSLGADNWFVSNTFDLNLSLYGQNERAVKGAYSDTKWYPDKYLDKINSMQNQLTLLEKASIELSPGKYKVYFTPESLIDLVGRICGASSKKSLENKSSILNALHEGKKSFSNQLTILDEYELNLKPSFSPFGEICHSNLTVIKDSKLTPIVSQMSSRELQSPANSLHDYILNFSILPGTLNPTDIFKELDTGIYVSNIWYVNCSNLAEAKFTGMTRYACLWVENGKPVAPIEQMRFNESLYDCLGDNLIALTNEAELISNSNTYSARGTFYDKAPGALMDNFNFNL